MKIPQFPGIKWNSHRGWCTQLNDMVTEKQMNIIIGSINAIPIVFPK